jgi:RecA-family ATPase
MHVALGWTYRGRRVKQGAIVYLALEGGSGFAKRVEAWRQKHLAEDHEPVPFYLLDVPVDLIADQVALIAAIKEQLGEQVPAAVVIDTLNRALVGDENKSDDMAKFIRAADAIRAAFSCVVPIVPLRNPRHPSSRTHQPRRRR